MHKRGNTIISVALIAIAFALGTANGAGRLTLPSTQMSSVNNGLPNQLDYTSVNQVYQAIKQNYDGKLTQTQLIDGMKAGLAEATGDPYTQYFNAEQAKDFNNQLNSMFSGIGAQLGENAGGALEIVAPIAGSPAEKAGLKASDVITEIDGASTTGLSIDNAVSKIRGKAGTKVTLQIVRDGQTQTITITREDITVPTVNTKTLDGNIGYIQITQFGGDTASLTAQTAQKFANDKVNGIVLDLRSNPGGYLDAAVDVSSLWLPSGTTILQEKRDGKVIQTYQSGDENATNVAILKGIPTVVLIDGGSASASEITAGALKDNGAATLIGEKSYGKGSVQTIDNKVGGDTLLKITIARWYRPNGQNIDKKGITPDQTVAAGQGSDDTQLQAALSKLGQ